MLAARIFLAARAALKNGSQRDAKERAGGSGRTTASRRARSSKNSAPGRTLGRSNWSRAATPAISPSAEACTTGAPCGPSARRPTAACWRWKPARRISSAKRCSISSPERGQPCLWRCTRHGLAAGEALCLFVLLPEGFRNAALHAHIAQLMGESRTLHPGAHDLRSAPATAPWTAAMHSGHPRLQRSPPWASA